jgi:hypothetical protein
MGGGEKTIPMFQVDDNNPSIPMEQKELTQSKSGQHPPQPFLSLQVSQPPPPKKPAPTPLQFFPTATVYPSAYPQVPTQTQPLGTFQAPINVVNQLVIGDQNPHQNHGSIGRIYEDVLPLKHLPNTVHTISDRLVLGTFIKNVILMGKDGAIIPFRGGDVSLYDRLKTTKLNPYHSINDDVLKNNPYFSLPKNMLLFQSCYPIKRDFASQSMDTVICAKDSIGMNLRLYRLTQGEMQINRSDKSLIYDSEVWREIMYYEYVRENIIKRKESPNFVMMFGYTLCKDSAINFDEIEQIKTKTPADKPQQIIKEDNTNIILNNPNSYANDILTALTEAPTYSLLQWASKEYANVGNSRRMINIGFHPDHIWQSIIFQIMASFCVMQKHGIYINNFSLRDNIYIKDLSGTSNVTSYWKYVINNISYYIPNYGFLVMIDSKFKDIPQSSITIGSSVKEHKIIGSMFDEPNKPSDDEITNKIIDALIDTINMNNLGNTFVDNGGIKPGEETQNIIERINKFAVAAKNNASFNKKDIIRSCIENYLSKFMNNRIGTILTKQEHEDINKLGKNFNKGDLIVYEEEAGVFKFVQFIRTNNGIASVYSQSGNNITRIQVQVGNLYEFSKLQPIKQNYKPNEAKMDDSDLLETYMI